MEFKQELLLHLHNPIKLRLRGFSHNSLQVKESKLNTYTDKWETISF